MISAYQGFGPHYHWGPFRLYNSMILQIIIIIIISFVLMLGGVGSWIQPAAKFWLLQTHLMFYDHYLYHGIRWSVFICPYSLKSSSTGRGKGFCMCCWPVPVNCAFGKELHLYMPASEIIYAYMMLGVGHGLGEMAFEIN